MRRLHFKSRHLIGRHFSKKLVLYRIRFMGAFIFLGFSDQQFQPMRRLHFKLRHLIGKKNPKLVVSYRICFMGPEHLFGVFRLKMLTNEKAPFQIEALDWLKFSKISGIIHFISWILRNSFSRRKKSQKSKMANIIMSPRWSFW